MATQVDDPAGLPRGRARLALLWPSPRPGPTAPGPLAVLLVLAVSLAVQAVRVRPLRDGVWAEDGTIFLADAVDAPLQETLLRPYAGYLHVLPRLLAEAVSWLPLAASAVALLACAVLVVSALALVLLACLADHVPSLLGRVVVVGFVVLLPVGRETVGNIANLHWFLLVTAVCVMFWTPRGRAGSGVAAVVVVLATLSNPFGPALLVLAAVRAGVRRDRTSTVLLVLLLVASVVQVLAVLSSERAGEGAPSPVRLVGGYVVYVIAQLTAGEELAGSAVRALAVGAVGLLLLAGVAAVGARSPRPRVPLGLAGVLALGSLATWSLFYGLSGVATPRYVVVPAVLLVVACAAVLSAPGATATLPRPVRGVLPALLVVVLAAWAVSLPLPGRSGGTWEASLEDATTACGTDGPEQVDVPIAPDGWEVTLDCDDLVP